MKQEKLERLMDEYTAALASARAAERAISRLSERLVPKTQSAATLERGAGKDGGEPPPLFHKRPAPPRRPTMSEIRTALEDWDKARRETRKAFRALKSTGSARVPKSPSLRAHDLWILKRAVSHGSFKTMQPPYSTVLELLAG
jgi:hypothetical protein